MSCSLKFPGTCENYGDENAMFNKFQRQSEIS